MNAYEIVNMSDACTILAESDKVAVAAIILLGEGGYGARCGGRSVLSLGLFGIPAEICEHFPAATPAESVAALMEFAKASSAVADALESFCYGDEHDREALHEAMGNSDSPAKVKAEFFNRKRSSMNDIGKQAAGRARQLREMQAGRGGK